MGYTGAYDLGNGLDVDPDDEPFYCEECGAELEWATCWHCHGEGQWDMHERLPLEYDPSEVEVCEECHGEGGYLECPNLPHKESK